MQKEWGELGIEPRASRMLVSTFLKSSPKARIIPLDHTPVLERLVLRFRLTESFT